MRFAYLMEPPFNFVDAAGRVTGCDVALARYVWRALGRDDVELVETEFAHLLPGLEDGQWQMTTGLFATPERQHSALFSRPIWALPDGLLVGAGNPLGLVGYRSIARNTKARLAVIRDQAQYCSAIRAGVAESQVVVYESYPQAAKAVRDGLVDAYASVARAHTGFIAQHSDWPLEVALVPHTEKQPAFGSFAFRRNDTVLRDQVDTVLSRFLGTRAHREMVTAFGFSNAEVDLVATSKI